MMKSKKNMGNLKIEYLLTLALDFLPFSFPLWCLKHKKSSVPNYHANVFTRIPPTAAAGWSMYP